MHVCILTSHSTQVRRNSSKHYHLKLVMSELSTFHRHRSFIILLAVATAVRLFFAVYLHLGDDEAYYWEWGQHPDLSYLDHPPMTGWIGGLFSSVFGNNEFGVRIGPILISVLFLILIYQFTRRLFGDDSIAFQAALLFSLIPLFTVGSFMLLPDAPLSLFWLASLVVFYRIVESGEGNLWFVLGAVWGLGMLSKYNMFALPPCIGLFLVLSAKHRFWLFRLKTWLGFGLGVLIFSPVLIWNIQRGFPSFAYHLVERNEGIDFSWEPVQIFLAGQLGYLSPLVFIAALVILWRLGKMALFDKDEKALFLFTMAFPYILVFSLACALSPTGKPHWPAMGYITLFCAMPWFWKTNWVQGVWWMKVLQPRPVIVLSAIFTVVLLTQSIYPVIKMDPRLDLTNDLYGWPEAGRVAREEYDRLSTGGPTILITRRLNMAAPLRFYISGNIPAYSITHVNEQYDIWGRGTLSDHPRGGNAVYVADSRFTPGKMERYGFRKVEALPVIDVIRAGRVVKQFFIFRFYDFKGVK